MVVLTGVEEGMMMRTYLIISVIYLAFSLSAYGAVVDPTNKTDEEIGRIFQEIMVKTAERPGAPFMRRPVFAKDHGCLKAKFTVNPKLAKKYRVGPFKPDSLPAWIRFSNDGGYGKDSREAARGMAVKLVGVEPKENELGEKNAVTQDFVMENHPTFFVNTAEEFLEMTQVLLSGDEKRVKAFEDAHPDYVRINAEIDARVLADPLDGTYWTPTPYEFVGRPMKYMAEPCKEAPDQTKKPRANDHYRRENLITHLKESAAAEARGEKGKEVCFNFFLRFQKNEKEEPIDLLSKEWTGRPILMGQLEVNPNQNIDDEDRKWVCEGLAFTGWHTAFLKPLGSINTARKYVYNLMADRRRKENDKKIRPVPLEEPTSLDLGTL